MVYATDGTDLASNVALSGKNLAALFVLSDFFLFDGSLPCSGFFGAFNGRVWGQIAHTLGPAFRLQDIRREDIPEELWLMSALLNANPLHAELIHRPVNSTTTEAAERPHVHPVTIVFCHR